MQRFDKGALLVLLIALLLWIAFPQGGVTGLALGLAGALHLARLARWAGAATLAEPLVFVLHGAYAFLPLGALAMAAQIALPGQSGLGASQHLWMGGALGLMTLAIMTRATLGHTGRALSADHGTTFLYICILIATVLRAFAGLLPVDAMTLYSVSAVFWVAGFGGFAVIYGPLLLHAKPGKAA